MAGGRLETLTYRVSWKAPAMMLVVFGILGAIGWAAVSGGAAGGWFFVGLGVFGVAGALAIAWPGRSYLRLDSQGVTIAFGLHGKLLPWADVQDFDTDLVARRKSVVYRLVESKRGTGAFSKGARGLLNYDGAIPSNYAVDAETLCTILRDYLKEAKSAAGITQDVAAVEADKTQGRKIQKKYSIIFVAVVLIVYGGYTFGLPILAGLKDGFSEMFDESFKKAYREKFVKDCEGQDLGPQKAQFCACAADATLAHFTKAELWKNDPSIGTYLDENVFPACGEKYLRGSGDALESKLPPSPYGPSVEQSKKQIMGAIEEFSASQQPPSEGKFQEKASGRSETGDLQILYLKNGQTMPVRISERDAGGVWVELDGGGGRVYFTNGEIKTIADE